MSIKASVGGGSQSVEPGFRIYGKNKAANEFSDNLKFKLKTKVNPDTLAAGGDFSFRAANGGTAPISPRNLG
jgi:hypothetical protein